MTRRYGRSARGRRADAAAPHGHWKVVTLTAAVRLDGVGACPAFDGATNSACFETYVGRCLVPTLKPGDIVVMDDLSCRKTAEVARLIAAAGAESRHLPAYSPDLGPIEEMFGKLEEFLRWAAGRTVDDLIDAMGDGLKSVTLDNILGWFNYSDSTGLQVLRCRVSGRRRLRHPSSYHRRRHDDGRTTEHPAGGS